MRPLRPNHLTFPPMFPLSSPLVLASASPRRRQILDMLGFAFETIPSDADETPVAGMPAEEIPRDLAVRKALAVERVAMIGMDEHGARGGETAVDGRAIGEQQAPVHAGNEGTQAAAAGARAGRDFELRVMAVPR